MKRRRKRTTAPRVRLLRDSGAIIAGLSFEDARSIVTWLSLQWFAKDKEHPDGVGSGCSNKDCRCGENHHENMKRIIDALKESIDSEIDKTHPKRKEPSLKEKLLASKAHRERLNRIMAAMEREHSGTDPKA